MTKLNKMNAIELEELKSYYYDNYSYDDLLMLTLQECDKVDELMEELQRKDNIINELKNGIKELDNMFYETFRISQDGYFSISEWELKDFTDKIEELEKM